MNSKGSTIIRFCQQLNRPGIGDVLAKYEPEASDKAACVLLLLMAYFKEPKNAIMLEADVSCLKNKKLQNQWDQWNVLCTMLNLCYNILYECNIYFLLYSRVQLQLMLRAQCHCRATPA
jgi:hypothetical protein